MPNLPDTLMDAVRYFADQKVCEDYMRAIKWPDGKVCCPNCGASGDRLGEIATLNLLRCKDCRKKIYSKHGTIFEDSKIGLDKWFVAVWSIANCKNGISSHELARAIGVTQKTAWFMLHRVRKAMEVGDFDKFDGPAEADTTYIGGAAANMHKAKRAKIIKGRGAVGKAAVHGVLQRGVDGQPSQVRCEVIGREDADTLLAEVRRHVKADAPIYTDSAQAYGDLMMTHRHEMIDHSIEYVRGLCHTNGLENLWSLLKRSIKGTWTAIAVFHLFRYVAEQVYRFNSRKLTDRERFAALMLRITGKRLTFRALCGTDGAGFMGLE